MSKTPPATFAQRLRALREAAGLTQSNLAEKMGTAQANISHLEAGRHEPKWGTVVKLADVLKVGVEDFR